MSRAENVREAQRLRAQGLKLREIGVLMGGVGTSTVSAWILDPDLSRQRSRREKYRGECEVCGQPTDPSAGPGKAPMICTLCYRSRPHSVEAAIESARGRGLKAWSDEALLEALREGSRRGLDSCRQWREVAPDDLPSTGTIISRFESWNRARELAGLPVTASRRKNYTRQFTEDVCVRAVAEAGRELGVVPTSLAYDVYRSTERPDFPSRALICIRCGGWATALGAAQQLISAKVRAA